MARGRRILAGVFGSTLRVDGQPVSAVEYFYHQGRSDEVVVDVLLAVAEEFEARYGATVQVAVDDDAYIDFEATKPVPLTVRITVPYRGHSYAFIFNNPHDTTPA